MANQQGDVLIESLSHHSYIASKWSFAALSNMNRSPLLRQLRHKILKIEISVLILWDYALHESVQNFLPQTKYCSIFPPSLLRIRINQRKSTVTLASHSAFQSYLLIRKLISPFYLIFPLFVSSNKGLLHNTPGFHYIERQGLCLYDLITLWVRSSISFCFHHTISPQAKTLQYRTQSETGRSG